MKFMVYEIWTRGRVVEAPTIEAAYEKSEPNPMKGLSLSNWHVVPLDGPGPFGNHVDIVGGLNARQVEVEE